MPAIIIIIICITYNICCFYNIMLVLHSIIPWKWYQRIVSMKIKEHKSQIIFLLYILKMFFDWTAFLLSNTYFIHWYPLGHLFINVLPCNIGISECLRWQIYEIPFSSLNFMMKIYAEKCSAMISNGYNLKRGGQKLNDTIAQLNFFPFMSVKILQRIWPSIFY